MGIRKIETDVGGAHWEMMTLPATVGLETFSKVVDLVGSPLGVAVGGIKDEEKFDMSNELFGKAVAKMASGLASPSTTKLVKTLLTGLRRDSQKVGFDDYFSGNYGELMELLWWSLRENFESFLSGNPAVENLVAKAQALMSERSTGGSGES